MCFVGDSFVNGTGDESTLGWVGRVSADALNRGFPVTSYNLGIRRNTSRDIVDRLEAECALRLPEGCDNRIVISCGVNDTVVENGSLRVPFENSIANLREMLRVTRPYNTLLVGPPPVGSDEHNDRIVTLSQAFARESRVLGVPFINLISPLVTDEAYKQEARSSDGAHPRSTGYEKMARIIRSSPDWWFHVSD